MPRPFPPSAPLQIFTVDFTEISTGLGYNSFYCFDTEDSTGIHYGLLSKVIETLSKSSTSSTLAFEFETTFKYLATMVGDAFVKLHWGFRSNGNLSTGALTLSLQKNGVEFASITTKDMSSTTNVHRVEKMKIVIPKTTFQQGDTFKMVISSAFDPDATLMRFLAHDPEDEATTPGSSWTGGAINDTIFKVAIPFKIEQ